MNPDSGRLYALGSDLLDEASYEAGAPGTTVWPESLRFGAEQLARELTDEERAALADPGPLVAVSADVAQRVRLGERELERRKARRVAAKKARKTNRR